MLHQEKFKFPGKLAISNTKNANLQIDVFRCFLAFFDRIAAEGRMRIPEIGIQKKDVTLLSSYR